MEPLEIRKALFMKDYTCASLARELKICRQTVHLVVSGRTASKRIRQRIAQIIGKPVHEIFSGARPNQSRKPKHVSNRDDKP
jgi:DNA-binding XRE family transcriptional regulator